MKTPPHLAHLFSIGGPNRAPIIDLSGSSVPKTETVLALAVKAAQPAIPPSIIRKGPGVLYLAPPAAPVGIITR